MKDENEAYRSIAENCKAKAAAAIAKQVPHEGDHKGEDGIVICGVCGRPRQVKEDLFGIEYLAPVKCNCELAAEREAERKATEKARFEEHMRLVSALKDNSLIDGRYKDATFKRFTETASNAKILHICKRYSESFEDMEKRGQGLLFYGGIGTGKTFAAMCIAHYLLEHEVSVAATSFSKAIEAMRGLDEDGEGARLKKVLKEARLLVLDDLGVERGTDFAVETMYNLIDDRYRSGKPMIITTNFDIRSFTDCKDMKYDRIYDRILGVCHAVPFTGTSWRKREAAERRKEMTAFLEGE